MSTDSTFVAMPSPQEERLLSLSMEERQLSRKAQEQRRQSVRLLTTKENRRRTLKGPLRALRLCLLSILLPGLLVAVPLYLRFHVYGDQMYPLGLSDMRLVDSRVSTTWCQRQLVKANATFNAFLLPESPAMEDVPVQVSMSRTLVLEDDMKEYWAFYLLKGSAVTVSSCVRWPGASLIVLRGHKHLHECAYIGDDSSEELDEMDSHSTDDRRPPVKPVQNLTELAQEEEAESNEPGKMRRARPEVYFHHGDQMPLDRHERLDHHSSGTDEELHTVLGQYLKKNGIVKPKGKDGSVASTQLREPMVGPRNDDLQQNSPLITKLFRLSTPKPVNLEELQTSSLVQASSKAVSTEDISKIGEAINTNPTSIQATSSEVFEDVLRKLRKLGPRGKKVLRRLNTQLENSSAESDEGNEERKLMRKMILNILQEEAQDEGEPDLPKRRKKFRKKTEKKADSEAEEETGKRKRRQILMTSPGLHESLTMHDEEADAAIEEGLTPDGIADHHKTLNETTPNDRSNSEFWSSFSSSEEALLNCAGLILNLPLTPHRGCDASRPHNEHVAASSVNTLTYRVPINGYYFFIFNSENEIQPNYIRVSFHLEKVMYNVSNPVAACQNSTKECALSLDFFSSEKVVLELPLGNNDTLWNQEFVAVSTCEPRTALYLGCVIAVPLLILLFAFQ